MNKRDHMQELNIDGRIIIKWTVKNCVAIL